MIKTFWVTACIVCVICACVSAGLHDAFLLIASIGGIGLSWKNCS